MSVKTDIIDIYIGYFNRAPDPDGLDYWIGRVNGGMSLAEVSASFSVQPESTTNYPYLANPTVATASTFVTSVYANLFNRVPDAAGLAYWVNELTNAAGSPAAIGAMILNIISGATTAPDSTILANKGIAGLDWVTDAADVGGFAFDAAALANAGSVLSGIDATDASVTAAATATDTFIANGGGAGGSTLALTSSVDDLIGTNGSDTFNAVYDAVTGGGNDTATLGALDKVDGGAGSGDVLNVVNQDTNGVTIAAAATVTNVEKLAINSAGIVTADVQGFTGLETVTATAAAGSAVNIDTKGNVTSVSVKGGTTVSIDDYATSANDKLVSVSVDGNAGALTVGNAAGTQETSITSLTIANTAQNATVVADSGTRELTLNLDTVTGGVIADAEATTLTVKASGGATTGVTLNAAKATTVSLDADVAVTIADVNIAAATSLTITGDSLTTVSATSTVTALTTIDASGTTGGTTITPSIGAAITYTGGDGVDTITVGATTKAITTGKGDDSVTVTGVVGTGGTIKGGDGTDTLVVNAASFSLAGMTEFETLALGAAGTGAYTASGFTGLSVGGLTGGVTFNTVAAGTTLAVTAATGQTLAYVLADATGTSDSLALSISNGAGINANTITAAGIETVAITVDDTTATPAGNNHTLTLVDAAAKTITVSGDAGLVFTHAGTALTSFDASGTTTATSAVTFTTAALANVATLSGGAGGDTLIATAATKAVTLNGNGGNDTLTAANALNNTINGGAGNDIIVVGTGANTIDAGAGNDTITVGAAAGLNTIDVGAGTDVVILGGIQGSGGLYTSVTGMAAGDSINFAAVTTVATAGGTLGAAIALGGASSFANYLDSATSTVIADAGASLMSWFQYNGNTYVVIDNTDAPAAPDDNSTFVDGNDTVIELVGLVDLSTSTYTVADVLTIV